MLILLQIAGGVALILFGIRFLRKGLDRLFGDRLPGLLQRLARNRWRAAEAAGKPIGLIPVGVWAALVGGVSFIVLLRPRLGRGE